MNRWVLAGARVVFVTVLLMAASGGLAATFVVTSTADTGGANCGSSCTLRQAINAANATPAADTINFAIQVPVRGALLIQPGSALPTITAPLTIDGYSQNGTAANTDPTASNARLRIRLDGVNAGASTTGLGTCANNTTIRGLAVTGFRGNGLSFGGQTDSGLCAAGVSGGVASGNFIGLATDGVTAAGNGSGVVLTASSGLVGGPTAADRNVISANATDGVSRSSATATSTTIQNNLIGTDKSGSLDRGNGGHGVSIGASASNVQVGAANAPNLIAFNSRGVRLPNSSGGNVLFANRIVSNDFLGIDLGPDGVTPNDPNDSDTGPNNLQNFPLLLTGVRTDTGVSVTGTLDVGNASTLNYRLALYASSSCDASGHGEGGQRLSDQSRALNTTNESFSLTALSDPLPPGTVLSMTATAPDGSTSEFSACFFLDPPPLVVNSSADPGTGTCDATECTLREAIAAVNARAEDSESVITFAIPGSGELMVEPNSPLPTISRRVLIDGYSQAGASPNTEASTSNAVVRLRLHGANAGTSASGFSVCADHVSIRGFSITGFASAGIRFGLQSSGSVCTSAPDGGQAAGNFVGLASNGVTAVGNLVGIFVRNRDAIIGGPLPADRNLISSNGSGINLSDAAQGNAQILNNLIGTGRDGLLDRGNTVGVNLGGIPASGGAENNLIGTPSAPNLIAFNDKGIVASNVARSGNTWFANAIHSSTQLGIDLHNDGVTANDAADIDSGANGLQNFPELTLAQRSATGLRLAGQIDAPPGAVGIYTIAAYANATCDAAAHGEGERFLGSFDSTIAFSVGEEFDVTLATDDPLPPGTQVTATATAPDGSTSEFSPCIAATDPPPGFVVTSTADTDGTTCGAACTLRQAINAANAQAGADQIRFDLPGSGPFIATPATELPAITEAVTIDGYTQLGASPNSDPIFSNAVIRVQINDTNNVVTGLRVCADDVVLRGLSITGFEFGIGVNLLNCGGPGITTTIQGNLIGVPADGAAFSNTSGTGVFASAASVELGGIAPADRNVISGLGFGVSLSASTGSQVLGNLFGTDLGGSVNRGNQTAAFLANGSSNNVLGNEAAPNRFGFNTFGIAVSESSTANRLGVNEHAGPATIPIDLRTDTGNGVTPNDIDDADAGGNNLQNFPVLTGGVAFSTSIAINGLLDVPAATSNAPYLIALYESAACNALGHGNGEVFLGTQVVSLSGNAESFSVTLPVTPPAPGHVITATATDPAGNTSELSACLAAPVILTVFADGFEG
ncbi:MAG: CSLREA domain-containing protein [Chiayiivirga sp.]|jgi:CSLREA domain-containing protein|uniref:beta strand repeat-containing protein n=1 Tax=Chiayiivirga sp. TaxID=2041042 RepID=UPI0025C249A5|nr:CSLREA domain-containing protein [Chiayiivirga sp.]MCI1729080.1 CSLREA domain-containing protein [Chiayiivirga sp.]